MRRLYLAGPMTNVPAFNFPAFEAAAQSLRADGFIVVSPYEINPDTSTPWAECMRRDIAQLVTCDYIAMLPGWEQSKGAKLERLIAMELGMVVMYLPASKKEVLHG